MKTSCGNIKIFSAAVCALLLAMAGCGRGLPFEKPPSTIDRGMSKQPKYRPQAEGDFFPDKSTMRMPVPSTVAREELRRDDSYYQGKDSLGNFVRKAPVALTMQILKRGRERFDIYCSPCHSRLGDGKGIMINRGYLPPPSYHTDRLRQIEKGYIFDVISNGIRNMPAYRHQVPVADRWAIVLYLRALQRSQKAGLNDIPEELRQGIK
ncbi:MAG: cytochrome c [candidate division Zixibacteria bacterium]|nr:cytochrome c [candidate division Zixibacteria bacterium]